MIDFAEKYKRARMARIPLIAFLSISWWFLLSDRSVEEFIAAVLCFAVLESLSLNMLSERDFYPANQYVGRVFPDKNSIGNKAMYWVHYLIYVFFVVYAFFVDKIL